MGKRKTWLAVLCCALLGSAACLGLAVSAAPASAGDTLIWFACDGTEANLVKEESSPLTEAGIFVYTNGGSNGAVKTTELYASGAHGVYEFDLADSVTEAWLNFVGGAFAVGYKAGGDADYTDVSPTYGPDQFQVYSIHLTREDALKSADRKFKVKFTNGQSGQINLYMVSVTAKEHLLTNGVKLVNDTVSAGLPYLVDAGGSLTYWDGAADRGFLHGNGQAASMVYRFCFDSEAVPLVKLTEPTLDGGVNAIWQYSTDGGATFAGYVPGTEIDTSVTSEIYVKFTTEAGYRLLVRGLGVEKVADPGKDWAEIYQRADGSATESAFVKEASGQQIYTAKDGSIGLGEVPVDVRLFDANGYIVYGFDLENSVTEAQFNLVGGDFKVEYSVNGGDYATLSGEGLTPGNHYFVRSYRLTEEDALAASTKAFRIRLTNPANGNMCLHSFGVFDAARAPEGEIAYENNTVTEGLKHVYSASGDAAVYYDSGNDEKGFAYLKAGGKIGYRFNIDRVEMPKPELTLGVSGGTLFWQYSTDGETFIRGGGAEATVQLEGVSVLYVEVKNDGTTDMLLRSITLKNNDRVAVGENANKNVPHNQAQSYFLVGSEAEKNHVFGTGGDPLADFNAAHSGMVRDGYEGGWADTEGENARKLLVGEYLAYDFDLPDGVTQAKLKFHGGPSVRVLVSTDNGNTATVLTPKGSAGSRGMYLFDLTEADALANSANTFRVVIQAAGESYVFALMVHENADWTAEGGVSLSMWSEGGLRALEETDKTYSYYSHSMYPAYFFKETGSYAVFKVKFSALVTDPVFYVNQCGDVKIELSGDGETYETVVNCLLGGTGEVPYNTFPAEKYRGENRTVWVRMSNGGSGGFVLDAGFSAPEKDTVSGLIGWDSFYNGLYGVTENNGIGTMLKINADGQKGVKIGGETVFRLNLPDAAYGVRITVTGLSGGGEAYLSADGSNYVMAEVLKAGAVSFVNYSSLKNNPNGVVYLKLKGGESGFVFESLNYTTEGIAQEGDKSKPYEDGDVSFNYDRELPGADSYGKPHLDDPAAATAQLIFNQALVVGLSVGGGCLALAAGGAVAVILILKKKRGAKQ